MIFLFSLKLCKILMKSYEFLSSYTKVLISLIIGMNVRVSIGCLVVCSGEFVLQDCSCPRDMVYQQVSYSEKLVG